KEYRLKSVLLFLLRRKVSFRLLANDVDQIAYRQVYIDQVQSPIRLNLPVHQNITDDVISPGVLRISVYSYLQISAFLIRDTLGRKQPGHADEWGGNRLRRRHPRTRLGRRGE